MQRLMPVVIMLVLAVGTLPFNGCKKKRRATVPTPPGSSTTAPDTTPAPAILPTISIAASPSSIERGQQSTLNWNSEHATSVVIDAGVGNVAPKGSLVVSPRESATFTASAIGPGGESRASTRITVVDRTRGIIAATDIEALQKAIDEGLVRPVFFAYDKAQLNPEAKRILGENASWFRRYPNVRIVVEGHCDEHGTEEYNLALGDGRARATQEYLAGLGVNTTQLETISFGEETPFSTCHDESCWRLNRRAHFVVQR